MRRHQGRWFSEDFTPKKIGIPSYWFMEVLHIVPVDGNVCGRNKDYTGRGVDSMNKESR